MKNRDKTKNNLFFCGEKSGKSERKTEELIDKKRKYSPNSGWPYFIPKPTINH